MFKFLKFLKPKDKNLFPCKECIVRPACKQACEKIEMDDEKLSEMVYKNKCCPDCGSDDFQEGPSGGMSINMRCDSCHHWFNVCDVVRQFDRIHVVDGRFT
jgi:hypothetical protein